MVYLEWFQWFILNGFCLVSELILSILTHQGNKTLQLFLMIYTDVTIPYHLHIAALLKDSQALTGTLPLPTQTERLLLLNTQRPSNHQPGK